MINTLKNILLNFFKEIFMDFFHIANDSIKQGNLLDAYGVLFIGSLILFVILLACTIIILLFIYCPIIPIILSMIFLTPILYIWFMKKRIKKDS